MPQFPFLRFEKRTDPVELTGKHPADKEPSGLPQLPSDPDAEGKRCGQTLLDDQSFFQAISSAVLRGLSGNTEKPHGSINHTETTASKRPTGEVYGPGDMVEKSYDSTAASEQTKHFRTVYTSEREIDLVSPISKPYQAC